MTDEQLRLRYIATIGRHWRTMYDRSGPTPGLLDELVDIARDHAASVRANPPAAAKDIATEGGNVTAGPPIVIEGGGGAVDPEPGATGGPGSSHRTRTRPRRSE